MGIILTNSLLEVLILLLIACWGYYCYYVRNFDYWRKRRVPHVKGVFPFGSYGEIIKDRISPGEYFDRLYKKFPEERYFGAYELQRPILVIRDPDLIKQILVADFNHFVDRFPFKVSPRESILRNLFIVDGELWKNMRHKSSPAFSSGKMKNMFALMLKCSGQLITCLDKKIETQNSIDVKDVLAKFTMDIIASCALGVEMNTLMDENLRFYNAGLMTFKPRFKLAFNQLILNIFPKLGEMLNIKLIEKENEEMFTHLIKKAIKFRGENDNCKRNDFLDILLKLRNNQSILDGSEEKEEVENFSKSINGKGLTVEEMVAQAFVFFVAGFETASSTMTFCLYELAQHRKEQERLCQEIQEVLQSHGGEITYQALQEMKYMDQVINETLRMYPSLYMLVRRCTQTYRIPGSDLVLEMGQKLYIPSVAIHHDPKYYPDPYKFDPERFTPENIKERHPYVHLPFGAGPRNCIGMRFGLMQTKIGLATFFERFRVEVVSETPIPMKLQIISIVTQSRKPVHLKVIRR